MSYNPRFYWNHKTIRLDPFDGSCCSQSQLSGIKLLKEQHAAICPRCGLVWINPLVLQNPNANRCDFYWEYDVLSWERYEQEECPNPCKLEPDAECMKCPKAFLRKIPTRTKNYMG